MTDNIEKEGIRRAIDRFQKEHPCHLTFDVTLFDNGTDFTVMQRAIDMVAKKCQEDADIHIICEMAKLYLEGVRPMVMPKQEWTPCSERLPEEGVNHLGWIERDSWVDGDDYPTRKQEIAIGWHIEGRWHFDGCNGKTKCIAWMPLPEPYRKEARE